MPLSLATTGWDTFVGLTNYREGNPAAGHDSLMNPTLPTTHVSINPVLPSASTSWKAKWRTAYRNSWHFFKARFSTSFWDKPWSVQYVEALCEVLQTVFFAQLIYIASYMFGSAWGIFLHEKHIRKQESEKQELSHQLDSMQIVVLKERVSLLRSSSSGEYSAPARSHSSPDNASF